MSWFFNKGVACMKILLVAYDNDSHVSYFPLGIGYIAAVCREAGHEVRIYNQDVYHWPEEHLTNLLDNEHFDVVGLGVIGGYYQYRKLLKISAAINQSKERPFYVLGGHGPSPEPEYFLKKSGANVVVIGEGETTMVDLLAALQENKSLATVEGIAYIDRGGVFHINPRRRLISDINLIPWPAWDLFPMEHYALYSPNLNAQRTSRAMIMVTGRGCNFKCNFCYRMDTGLRIRSEKSIIAEIKVLHGTYGITYFAFWDELLMSSIARVRSFCQQMIRQKLDITWECNGRLNYAERDILDLMKQAGCVFINYGIECMDDKILRVMNKALTTKQIVRGIENTLAAGIHSGFNIIFGNIGENAETLQKGVDFLLKYDDHAQMRTIRPVTPYPGSPLYYYAIQNGLLEGPEDFYERKHVNSDLLAVNFTELSDDEFHRLLFEANKRLVEKYSKDQCATTIEAARKLYLEKDLSFRGFRQV